VKGIVYAQKNSPQIAHHMAYDICTISYQIAIMKPIQVSIWDGVVMGAGLGLSVNSKIRIATENAKLAMPEVKIGIFPDAGTGYFMSRLRKGIGMYLALTGTTVVGREIVQIGLADYFVQSEKLSELESELKRDIIKNPSINIKELQDVVEKYATKIETKFKLEDFTEKHFMKESCFAIYDSVKLAAEVDKNEAAQKTWKNIQEACPKSFRVAFEVVKRGKLMTLKDDMEMEATLLTQITAEDDFFEGFRAKLVDKDNKPQWKHKNIYEVKDEEVERYFKLPRVDLDQYWKRQIFFHDLVKGVNRS